MSDDLTPELLAKLESLDAADVLMTAYQHVRRALAVGFEKPRGEAETYLVQAAALMLDAHEAIVAACEVDS
jgi:hypothetical protein